jgi:5-methyltetrahydropteroyltriglutamate--homocysteine methyltransferase
MPSLHLNPPFRVEHVGSFLRPERLLDAARKAKAGTIAHEEFRRIQDEAIVELVRFEEGLGLGSITDGEYRRRLWSAGFFDAVPGFGLRDGALGSFRDERGEVTTVPSPYAKQRLKRTRGIATDEFAYLKKVVKKGVPKITIPSPPVMHFFLGPRAVDETVYPDINVYFDDLTRIYREEIADLAKLGCTYLQLDDTALPCNCDDHVRDEVKKRGEDPDALTATYARLINDAIRDKPADMTVGMHLCRGNLKGAWMAEGGYEPIADKLFNAINVDAYFLEYDTARAGDFKPLRFVPKHKSIVLGLVSTKTPQLESKDELKRRIDEASKFVPLNQLCLSPQCGFSSSGGGGHVLTMDDTRRKIELMNAVARDVWG